MANTLQVTLRVGQRVQLYDAAQGTNIEAVVVTAGGGTPTPPLGGFEDLTWDGTSVIPGASHSSGSVALDMGGEFVADTTLLLWFSSACALDAASVGVIHSTLTLETSIDNGATWQPLAAGTMTMNLGDTGPTIGTSPEWQFAGQGGLDFTAPPTGDAVLVRLTLENSADSTESISLETSATAGPRVSYLLTAA